MPSIPRLPAAAVATSVRGLTATTHGATLRAAQHVVVQAQEIGSRVANDVAGG